jgi:hypothetical protein
MGWGHLFIGGTRRNQRHQREGRGRAVHTDSSTSKILRTHDSHPGFRKYFSSRTDGEPQFVPPDHDPPGNGVLGSGEQFHRDVQCERDNRQGRELGHGKTVFLINLSTNPGVGEIDIVSPLLYGHRVFNLARQ